MLYELIFSIFYLQHFSNLLILNGRDMTGQFLWITNELKDANNITRSVSDILKTDLDVFY